MLRPRKQDHLIEHPMDDEVLLYDPAVDRTHRLNTSARLIWERCDGRHTINDIANTLTECFDVEFETALHDARAVIEQLEQEQLLSDVSAA